MKTSKLIRSWTLLSKELQKRKRKGQRIVFTNGCFDLVHAGHVAVLQKSKALGDCLVVALNSDASTRRLKGPTRPLAPEVDRAEVIGALACVDYVTFFDQETPYELLSALRPDVLVKGGDYRVDQIVGRDLVKKVARVPLLKGRSTTALVQKILKAHGC